MAGRPGKVRIIGGEWRGRKLNIADAEGLRPTPDRVRETLFNWLQDVVPGSRCLDLFAGSGALGVEAASRGAKHVDLVEQSPVVARCLRAELERLGSAKLQLSQQEALVCLSHAGEPYDLVFLDPPFGKDLLRPCIENLEKEDRLAPLAWVYLECERDLELDELPTTWRLHRHKKAGQVGYHLYIRDAANG